jgi:hypothetical protein
MADPGGCSWTRWLAVVAPQTPTLHSVTVSRRIAWGLCFVVALVGNPSVACGPSASDSFTYGEGDMERAVVGTYSGSAGDAGAAQTLTLTIARVFAAAGSHTTSLQPQCGNRTFFKPAGACVSSSAMLVTGDLQSAQQPIPNAQLNGEFLAFHTLVGSLDMTGGGVHMSATYADGHFSNWNYTGADGVVVPLKLTRTK